MTPSAFHARLACTSCLALAYLAAVVWLMSIQPDDAHTPRGEDDPRVVICSYGCSAATMPDHVAKD